jgi:hypothetical protein
MHVSKDKIQLEILGTNGFSGGVMCNAHRTEGVEL